MQKALILIAILALNACSRAPVRSPTPAPTERAAAAPTSGTPAKRVTQQGTASWYGPGFHGKPTTSGEIYDQNALTAAHKTLPLGSRLRVTNLSNEKVVDVRVNDRGPFVGNRILDLSFAAASKIGMIGPGTAEIFFEVLESPVEIKAIPASVRYAIQLGSYSSREAAEAAMDRLRESVKGTEIVSTRAGGETRYRVRMGSYSDVNDAKAEAARLKRSGIDTVVVER